MNEIKSLKQIYFNEYLIKLSEINIKVDSLKYQIDFRVNELINEIYLQRFELFKQTEALKTHLNKELADLELTKNDSTPREIRIKLDKIKKIKVDYKLTRANIIELGCLKKISLANNELDLARERVVELKDYRKGLALVNKSLARNSYNEEALLLKGTILYELNQHKQAIECFDTIISGKSIYLLDAFVSKGKTLIRMNELETAFDCLNKAIQFNNLTNKKEICLAYLTKGNLFQIRNEFKNALECFNKSIEIDSKCVEAYYLKCNLYKKLNFLDHAIDASNQIIGVAADANSFAKKANLLCAKKDYFKAVEFYNRALELNPFHSHSLNNKGAILAKELGDFIGALECFDLIIQIEPNCASSYNGRGVCLKHLNDFNSAIDCFNQAIWLDPFHKHAYLNRMNML